MSRVDVKTIVDDHSTPKEVDPAASSLAEDRNLIARVRNGEKEAYRRLVEKYQQRAFLLAFDIVQSREDAEDVVQESFVKAYLSLREFKQESAFYTWLYRIVYNMAIDYRRKLTRRGGATLEYNEQFSSGAKNTSEENSNSGVLEDRAEGPQDALLRKEQTHKLKQALQELSDEHRAAVTLREIDGLSYDEIARITGVAKGTVMSRLHYARKKIQSVLDEE